MKMNLKHILCRFSTLLESAHLQHRNSWKKIFLKCFTTSYAPIALSYFRLFKTYSVPSFNGKCFSCWLIIYVRVVNWAEVNQHEFVSISLLFYSMIDLSNQCSTYKFVNLLYKKGWAKLELCKVSLKFNEHINRMFHDYVKICLKSATF